MKVTRLRTIPLQFPFDPPIDGGLMQLRSAECILVLLETDSGLIGEGLLLTLNGTRTRLVNEMVLSFEPLIVGRDPDMSGAFLDRAWRDVGFLGRTGLTVFGISGIDSALLDLRAKAADLNVSRFIGMRTAAVPLYHSGGLWISRTIDELQREASDLVARGYRAMKMRVGKPTIDEDVARVRAVRASIGPTIDLMVDANQQFSVARSIRFGRLVEDCRLAWFEEPIAYDDHHGEAVICAALDTPIASGESEYTSAGMFTMLSLQSADILMPDLQRMGGPTEFLKASTLAAAYKVPISSHLFPEMSLPLLATASNAIYLEYMPWTEPAYLERIELDAAGAAVVPTRPGWGFGFDPAAIRRFAM
jgi:L-alanine-DL-glutamate epimerase-like enolase superfamily enzyme